MVENRQGVQFAALIGAAQARSEGMRWSETARIAECPKNAQFLPIKEHVVIGAKVAKPGNPPPMALYQLTNGRFLRRQK